MFSIFLVCTLIFVLALSLYILNESQIDVHIKATNKIQILKIQFIKQHQEILKSGKVGFKLPTCTGIFVMDNELSKIMWQKANDISFVETMLDPTLKQKIIVRASSGGGLVTLPWKQRNNNNEELKPINGTVFTLSENRIGIILTCL